ncbi:MAG: metallophosphoesterase [Planctomycetota bacterium]
MPTSSVNCRRGLGRALAVEALAVLAVAGLALTPSCHDGGGAALASGTAASNSFENQPLPAREQPPFSFVVTGHIYGRPGADQPRPASTLQQNAQLLAASAPDFSVLLGDTIFGWQASEIGITLPFLRSNIPGPIFNPLGNHELSNPQAHATYFGQPWHAFDHAGCRMIALDSESNPWLITGQQRLFLLEEIAQLERREQPPALVCLFAHKPFWAMTPKTVLTAMLGNAANNVTPLVVGHNEADSFARTVLPRLRALSQSMPVMCFAGDFGAFPPTNMHLFAQVDPEAPNLSYYGVGLGDDMRDAFLAVDVPAVGPPVVSATQLTTGLPLRLEDYSHARWLERWFPHGLPPSILILLGN